MTTPRILVFLLIETLSVILVLVIALIATPDGGTLGDSINLIASGLTILTFFNGGITWLLFRTPGDQRSKVNYERLTTAASRYHAVFARLETGNWTEQDYRKAVEEMAELDGAARSLSPVQRWVWYRFYQAGRNIAGNVIAAGGDVATQQNVWRKNVNTFSNHFDRVVRLETFGIAAIQTKDDAQ